MMVEKNLWKSKIGWNWSNWRSCKWTNWNKLWTDQLDNIDSNMERNERTEKMNTTEDSPSKLITWNWLTSSVYHQLRSPCNECGGCTLLCFIIKRISFTEVQKHNSSYNECEIGKVVRGCPAKYIWSRGNGTKIMLIRIHQKFSWFFSPFIVWEFLYKNIVIAKLS